MKAHFLVAAALLSAAGSVCRPAVAQTSSATQVNLTNIRVNSDGLVFIRTSPQVPNSCTRFGEHLLLDMSAPTPGLEILLEAVFRGRSKVKVWYNDSTAPGTEPCLVEEMATLFMIEF